jgi:hypothetical protein
MNEYDEDKADCRKPAHALGVTALTFAGFFALLAILFAASIFFPSTEGDMDGALAMPIFSFVLGHIFAFTALGSRDLGDRCTGRLALRILWLSVAILAAAGFVHQRFMTS